MFKLLSKWFRDEEGVAAVESALIFPIMLTLMIGVFDAGNAIIANQKAVRASQVVADLIARNSTVTDTSINEAIEAGRLAFEPLPNDSFGVDIVSMRFDEDADTEIVWRETVNISALPDAADAVVALQEPNEGIVMVTVDYRYEPLFIGFVLGVMNMREVAFSRGRSAAVVTLEP